MKPLTDIEIFALCIIGLCLFVFIAGIIIKSKLDKKQ